MRLHNYITEKESLFDKDADYIIKDSKVPNSYIISKWTRGRGGAKDVYTVTEKSSKWSCNCPSGRSGSCKHVTLVKGWIKKGKPLPGGFMSDDELYIALKGYGIDIK